MEASRYTCCYQALCPNWYIHTEICKYFLGSLALRKTNGSPFIQIFCEVLLNNYQKLCLREMMDIVTTEMEDKKMILEEKRMTVPCMNLSAFKDIYFSKYCNMLLLLCPGNMFIHIRSLLYFENRNLKQCWYRFYCLSNKIQTTIFVRSRLHKYWIRKPSFY